MDHAHHLHEARQHLSMAIGLSDRTPSRGRTDALRGTVVTAAAKAMRVCEVQQEVQGALPAYDIGAPAPSMRTRQGQPEVTVIRWSTVGNESADWLNTNLSAGGTALEVRPGGYSSRSWSACPATVSRIAPFRTANPLGLSVDHRADARSLPAVALGEHRIGARKRINLIVMAPMGERGELIE